jgi:hypothetical protein
MRDSMKIRDLFASDVTRDIPPVVYFHEQNPEKLANEVSEYIITGGWPDDHPNHRRVPNGIHEQYVRLLNAIADELEGGGSPSLPAVWISGFYGSGKSAFAKLLGLALDGVALPNGTSIAEAWLARNTSPKAAELRDAWRRLRSMIDPLAVVFDIGGVARDGEQIHAAALRQVQRRLGYCTQDPAVADFELKLERDGEWARFERSAHEALGEPWEAVKDRSLAEDKFSLVMHHMYPTLYTDPMTWYESRAGAHARNESPQEAVLAMRDMIDFRRTGATLFLVIDEVSQFVVHHPDRTDRLRVFATELGAQLKGRAWLLALGQQQLDAEADAAFLVWARDRFPPHLRVHLAATNIRDVVHKRLLHKTPEGDAVLRDLFEKHRHDLKLYAYGCELVTPDEFVETYPMLPGQIELILQLTSALRTRSARAQGDDQAIRGLLQLLGELFRNQQLADGSVGDLVTLDHIYDVQHTALDAEIQASMARVHASCADDAEGLLVRTAKVVALLELIQDTHPTTAEFVAQCLFEGIDRGPNLREVTAALEELKHRTLLGYSERNGYKLQSTAGEEWDRERRDIGAPRDAISGIAQEALKYLIASPDAPRHGGRPFPWAALYSDGRQAEDVPLTNPRDEAVMRVDYRLLPSAERSDTTWVTRSGEGDLKHRLLWVAGDADTLEHKARDLHRARAMVAKYSSRRASLSDTRKVLLQQEENRAEDLERQVRQAVADTWMTGRMYFRGRGFAPSEHGNGFTAALTAAANRVLPDIYPQFTNVQILPTELIQLLEVNLSGPTTKFLPDGLGILELDAGRYVPTCLGVIPQRIKQYLDSEGGASGNALITHFGGPPYGYVDSIVKASVAGLLRAGQLKIQSDDGDDITAIRDAGVRDLFERDRSFRRATIFPAGKDDVGPQARARIARFFHDRLNVDIDREDHAIADAVAQRFPALSDRIREVQAHMDRLPHTERVPFDLSTLRDAVERGIRLARQTRPTVQHVKTHLDTLNAGVQQLNVLHAELTDTAIDNVLTANALLRDKYTQLDALNAATGELHDAAERIREHLTSPNPWRGIDQLAPDLKTIERTYTLTRRELLLTQERELETARARVRRREGFSTLTSDAAHHVLRPFANASMTTEDTDLVPILRDLNDRFAINLKAAEEEANERLDQVLSEQGKRPITRVALNLTNREITSEADLEALLEEIKQRLQEHLQRNERIRIT